MKYYKFTLCDKLRQMIEESTKKTLLDEGSIAWLHSTNFYWCAFRAELNETGEAGCLIIPISVEFFEEISREEFLKLNGEEKLKEWEDNLVEYSKMESKE